MKWLKEIRRKAKIKKSLKLQSKLESSLSEIQSEIDELFKEFTENTLSLNREKEWYSVQEKLGRI